MTKATTIGRILEITGKAGNTVYFDRLEVRTNTYLQRLLKAVERLAKK